MISEALLEEWALSLFGRQGYAALTGAELDAAGERADTRRVVLEGRLRAALERLNPDLPHGALEDALRRAAAPEAQPLAERNRAFHRLLVEGVPVEYQRPDGSIAGGLAALLDYERPERNDWLVVRQLVVRGPGHTRRPDLVVYLNGLPLAVIELKNPSDVEATTRAAHGQLGNYQEQIPELFVANALLVVSDGIDARLGALGADFERFMPWRTVEGLAPAPSSVPQLQVLIEGVFERGRLLELLRWFIVFEDQRSGPAQKKIAGYHQFHAVREAVAATVAATGPGGSRRCGVVWHTQGSGKSLTMVFYAARLAHHPALRNPTIVVLTDRNDLDGQLFGVFARCQGLLRQTPRQAEDSEQLRELLDVASGGVVFSTIQKFLPPEGGPAQAVSLRDNIVVIADEAHRSQYGFGARLNQQTGELSYGFAQRVRDALPNAAFLGFTGTPIEQTDRNTRQVFGDYISIYDIEQAVRDGATVPIFYESRIALLDLDERERPRLDQEFEEVTEGEEVERKEALKSKWSALGAIVGTERRLERVARDLLAHFDRRNETLAGKGMIVCMSRQICIDLYRQLVALRPEWHSDDDEGGGLKIVMTGSSSDPSDWQPHIRTKARREKLGQRFRDADSPLRLVIVRDMWLTGFDAPCLHTMYVDKPMHSHSLMQAIARVNRVFRDKPGGLVVDYLGLADQLRAALETYTQSGGAGTPTADQADAVLAMRTKYEICAALFHGFDWSSWRDGAPGERLSLLPAAQDHIFDMEDGVARLSQTVTELSQAHALAMPAPEALDIRTDVAFFQAVRAAVLKTTAAGRATSDEQLDHAVRQLVARAIAPGQVIDLFSAAGLPKPDLGVLSEEFLAEVRGMPHRHLAVELLRRLLGDELRARTRTSVVRSRSFADLLERSIRAYQNRAIETVQVIEELIDLARDIRADEQRGVALGLSPEERAFYEALEVNDSAVKVLGDDKLKAIARDLTQAVRRNITIDWAVRESVRAKMRLAVKRVLKNSGYPPDKEERATQTVLEQAELLGERWAEQ
ncbi:MAG TPA: type I restriction endonuclease subunit R [Roseiflexaceae bacterium]|nr:type I restriction endonuclease subunit R [Roseiflexaceae bacterium]